MVKEFRRLWSDLVEHTAADRAWPITDTDSVLCTFKELMKHYHSVSLTVAAVSIAARTQMYLLTYLIKIIK